MNLRVDSQLEPGSMSPSLTTGPEHKDIRGPGKPEQSCDVLPRRPWATTLVAAAAAAAAPATAAAGTARCRRTHRRFKVIIPGAGNGLECLKCCLCCSPLIRFQVDDSIGFNQPLTKVTNCRQGRVSLSLTFVKCRKEARPLL